MNGEGKILVHHYKKKTLCGVYFENLYLLLRETIEPNETIEKTLARGLMEEFGAKGELVRYLVSIKGKIPANNPYIEKTTLYFLVRYLEHDVTKREAGSVESESDTVWMNPNALIPLFKVQKAVDDSLDESIIIERFLATEKNV